MTDKMREAATQALEALEKHCTAFLHHEEAYVNAIIALRTALAEQPAEPVAKLVPGTMKSSHEPQPAIPPGYKLVPVEPTEEMIDAAKNNGAEGSRKEIAGDYKAMLNAAPEAPQPAKREPLTNADLKRVINAATMPSNPDDVGRWVVNVCRAIERAHGIGGGV